MSLSNYYFDLISNKNKGPVSTTLRGILWMFSLPFGALVLLRRQMYRSTYRSSAFVISVGNLVAGGTGKTPFCIFLAQELAKKGSLAVVVRAYKASAENMPAPLCLKGTGNAAVVGDEACLIAR